MLMSFVVDDHTFNVDQKLPAEEKAPVTYPNTLPESFTKYGLQGRGWGLLAPCGPPGSLCGACGSGAAVLGGSGSCRSSAWPARWGSTTCCISPSRGTKTRSSACCPGSVSVQARALPVSAGLARFTSRLGLLEVVLVQERVAPGLVDPDTLCRGHRLWKDPFHCGARASYFYPTWQGSGAPQSCDRAESPPSTVSGYIGWGPPGVGARLLPGRKKRVGPPWTPSGVSCRPSRGEGLVFGSTWPSLCRPRARLGC